MKYLFNGERLAKAVRQKRIIDLDIDIRDAAKKIGISAATLSRVENKSTPDVNTFCAVCNWIDISMEYFFLPKQNYKTKKH